MRRLLVVGLVLLAATAIAGCRPQRGGPAPTPTPSPASGPSPAGYRVAIVDLGAAIRAHRRFAELAALSKKIDAIQVRLASPPPPPEVPAPTGGANLQGEADRLQTAYRAELDALRDQLHARVEAFANDVRAEQEAKLADRQRELNAELTKTLEAKRDELQRDLERFELATMAEYRIPLLNLRVKADVVGVSNEEEAKRIQAESERITKERDEKVRTRAQALEKQLQEFSQTRNAEAEAKFKAYIAALEEEAKARVEARTDEARAELEAEVKKREKLFTEAMEGRRKLVTEGAQDQLRAAQERYARQVEAESRRLRVELQELTAQRLRLEDSMLAEIKIEIATLAQERRIDAVLTQALGHRNVLDLTPDLIARLKRS
ncbi:MAG: hypothetical protein QN178_07920 [Armatimonadota bacterium]|nr:hypothetical protein [Armatimonadota bacterium]